VLGQDALTSPEHFGNAAQPVACRVVEKRAIGYMRVSSVGGRSGPEYHTLDIQRASIERTARSNGYELVDVLTDEDQSGRSRNRPQFGIAMDRILAGDADAIIVWKVSRFSRNWREAAEDVELLLGHDKDLLSEEGFDTASTGGRLLLRILFVLANWEHEVLGEHWEVIKAKAVRDRGSHLGASPTGYRAGEGGVLSPDTETANLVVSMFEARAAGTPWRELADMMARRKPRPSRYTRQDVERIITNRVYLGETRWRAQVRTDAHVPLVSESLWRRANDAAALEASPQRRGPRSREFPLTGWLRCSGCGATMGGSVLKRARNRTYSIYLCNRAACENRQSISAPAAEQWSMAQAEALYATLALVPVEESDEQIASALAAVGDVAVALHELASVQARRALGDDWLPMMGRLRQEKGAAEDMVRDLRRKHQVPSSSVRWKDLTAEDCWAALRNMAPLGALVAPVVGYRNPPGRLSFIVDDELDAVAGGEPTD
jgi:DNA invertase Pin-like site-specific DNA recombinase